MTGGDAAKALLRKVLDVFRDAGWRNEQDAALAVAKQILASQSFLASADRFRAALPPEFLTRNQATSERVRARLIETEPELLAMARDASVSYLAPIVQMDAIDSFARVSDVPATQVERWVKPLDMFEDDIERMIAQILGQP